MQVEEFLRGYFQDRTNLYRQSRPLFAKHAQQFFTPTYQLSNHEQSIADSEAEKIISVKNSNGQAEIITNGFTSGKWRMRYQLIVANNSWAITAIELECGICHGSGKAKDGKSDCKLCDGVGWKLIGNKRAVE